MTDLLPHSIAAEQALIGGALLSLTQAATQTDAVPDDAFYFRPHQHIWRAIRTLIEADTPPDDLTVAEELRRSNLLEAVGGPSYLLTCQESLPTAAHAPHYAAIVLRHYSARRLHDAGAQLQLLALDPEAEELWDTAEETLLRAQPVRQVESMSHVRPDLVEVLDRVERQQNNPDLLGVPTGISLVDDWIGGLQPGDLFILAGRPAQGKTALALQFAVHGARHNYPVAIFSLEMDRLQIAQRLVQNSARIDGRRLQRGHLRTFNQDGESDWDLLGRTVGELGELPLWVDDQPGRPVATLRSAVARLQRQLARDEQTLGLVVVDYLQLLTAPGRDRVAQMTMVSGMLKGLARHCKVPVLALSQFSRDAARAETPELHHLRDSGSIEQDADAVLLMVPAAKDEEPAAAVRRRMVLAKNRRGPTGVVNLMFEPAYTRFVEVAPFEGDDE